MQLCVITGYLWPITLVFNNDLRMHCKWRREYKRLEWMPQSSQMIEYFGLFRSDFIDDWKSGRFSNILSMPMPMSYNISLYRNSLDVYIHIFCTRKKVAWVCERMDEKHTPNINNKNHNKWLSKFIQCFFIYVMRCNATYTWTYTRALIEHIAQTRQFALFIIWI